MAARKKRSELRRENGRKRMKLTGMALLCLSVVLLISTTAASEKKTIAKISLAANSISFVQNEEMPALKAKASCPEGLRKAILDDKTGYTVQDLLDELNQGEGYDLRCEADGSEQGRFPIHIELREEFIRRMSVSWLGRVEIALSDGVCTVTHKIGGWEGDRFRRYDGSYKTNEFLVFDGNRYYLDEEGKKVTGWREVDGKRYHFDEQGVMQANCWMKQEDGVWYLGEDGTPATGWKDLDGATYYFDESGKMQTGEIKIGIQKCVFGEDGKLVSSESSIDADGPMMALTFDDGPGARTNELLAVLEQYHAHATFFMQGVNIPGHEDAVRKMKEIGCELGNHTYSHQELTKRSAQEIQDQIGRTNSLLQDICGQAATVMRPPYGSVNDTVRANAGMPMILWNIDTIDWKTKNAQATIDCVLQTADDGDIVLMHDIHTTSVDAAIALIPALVEKGYQLVTVSELAAARGIQMENGAVYTDFNR